MGLEWNGKQIMKNKVCFSTIVNETRVRAGGNYFIVQKRLRKMRWKKSKRSGSGWTGHQVLKINYSFKFLQIDKTFD